MGRYLNTIKAVIFDWGDTVMRDFPEYQGPMAHWPRVEMIKGIDNALDSLHSKLICCLASNAGDSDAELMGEVLSRVNLHRYFSYLFTSRELRAKKPDLIFYQEILRRLELRPEECVAVGNDYLKDIVPAKSIGMMTIWFSQNAESAVAPAADIIIDSMDKLVSVIENLSQSKSV